MPFRRKRHREDHEFDGPYHADDAYPDDDDAGPADALGFGDDDYYAEEHKPRSPARRVLGCLIPVAIVAGIAFGGYAAYRHLVDNFGSTSCRLAANGYDYQWDPEQAANAATIVDVGVFKKGLPPRAGVIAATTAIQESKLRNLSYGDLDSLGLFQQRPSQGWGTADQIQDPVYSTGSFYNALTKIDGWETMPVGKAAQEVQRSGFPDAYDEHESQGEVIAAVMTGAAREGIGCRLDPAKPVKTPTQVADTLKAQSSLVAQAGDGAVTFRGQDAATAWSVAAWSVAHAQNDGVTSVTVGDRAWERHRGKDGWKWRAAKQPTAGPTTVRIELASAQ